MILTLASASPRRRELIKNLPFAFRFATASVSEINEGLAEDVAVKNAKLKAEKVFELYGGIVVGADTVVEIDGKILGKPADSIAAESMFRILCDNTHRVVTGIFVVGDCDFNGVKLPKIKKVSNFEKTYVTFNAFDKKIVYNYIKSGAPFDKAGGYGVQDDDIKALIGKVDGDIDNVIGLPVRLLNTMLKENFS